MARSKTNAEYREKMLKILREKNYVTYNGLRHSFGCFEQFTEVYAILVDEKKIRVEPNLKRGGQRSLRLYINE